MIPPLGARTWRAAQLAAVGALTVAAAVLAGVALTSTPTHDVAEDEPLRPARKARPAVAVLGDSWMAGDQRPDLATALAARLDLPLTDVSQPDAGFVSVGERGDHLSTFAQVASDLTTRQPGVDIGIVLVAGGYDDYRSIVEPSLFSSGEMVPQIDATLDAIAHELPDVPIAVLGPFWYDDHPPAEIRSIDRALTKAARAHDVPFVSPIREKWITGRLGKPDSGNAAEYIDADTHLPNRAGVRYLARRIVTGFRDSAGE